MRIRKKHKRFIARIMLVIMTLVTILSIATIITGCGKSIIFSGEVYGKEYQPYHEWTEDVSHPIRVGKITTYYYTTEHRHSNEKYLIHVRRYNDSAHYYEYESIEVNKEVYDSYDYGDIYIPDVTEE